MVAILYLAQSLLQEVAVVVEMILAEIMVGLLVAQGLALHILELLDKAMLAAVLMSLVVLVVVVVRVPLVFLLLVVVAQ
jgi:hypothetical protein